ncbi:hypothetical protein OESDEN_05441 [Oesophagostomum dentatum]|uniref:Uncharacterized protein n=1 Tax=Oesophagostomum dentatum TaxID=61180 RepID=A0A0B1TEX6_OESDE|nr:hypothetical protein OESDEN_05441 [Oesophagostomum dentatum]
MVSTHFHATLVADLLVSYLAKCRIAPLDIAKTGRGAIYVSAPGAQAEGLRDSPIWWHNFGRGKVDDRKAGDGPSAPQH